MRTATIAIVTVIAALTLGGCEMFSLLDKRCLTDAECSADEICTDAGFCVPESAFNNLPDGDFIVVDSDREAPADLDAEPDVEYLELVERDEAVEDGDIDADLDGAEFDIEDGDTAETDPEQSDCLPPEFVCFENGGASGNDSGYKCDNNRLQFCRPQASDNVCIANCSCSTLIECPEGCSDLGNGVADCSGTDGDVDGDFDIELEGDCEDGASTCAGWEANDYGFAFVCAEGSWQLLEPCQCGPCMGGFCSFQCMYTMDHCVDNDTQAYIDPREGCCASYVEDCPTGQVCSVAHNGCIEENPDGDIDGECQYTEAPVCFAGGGIYGSDMGLKCGTDKALYFCEPQWDETSCTKTCECELIDACYGQTCLDSGGGQAECSGTVDGDQDIEVDWEISCIPGQLTCIGEGPIVYQVTCNQAGDGVTNKVFCTNENDHCSEFVCNPDGIGCIRVENTAVCNDGLNCTANDRCSHGVCTGTPISCPASPSICKDSVCLENGGCSLVNNTAMCEDGNLCTVNDRCRDGACGAGQPLICPSDNNVCTQEYCDAGKGCTTTPVSGGCSDLLDCTGGDHCVNGECIGAEIECVQPNSQCQAAECIEGSGCVVFNLNGPCSDGSACTVNDYCSGGVCVPGAPLTCADDGNVCTTEYCDPTSGCRVSNNTNNCSDGKVCTTNDKCSGGVCSGSAVVCADDGNICTDAVCVEGTGCVQNNNTKACDDGKVCTTSDKCSGGVCSGSAVVCPSDNNTCTSESCVEGTGCRSTPLPNGTSCNDSSACTSGDVCTGGVCGGTAVNCSDGNVCTQDICNPASGCSNPPVANGTNCRLTSGGYGQCTNGQCIPVIICTPGQMVCESSGGVTTEKICSSDGTYWETETCDDSNSCTTNHCKVGVGCYYQDRPNGSPCSEGGSPGQCINSTCIVEVDGDSDCPAVPTPRDIPDGNTSGLESYIYKDENGMSQRVCVKVDITHPYTGDLEVRIVAPNGQYKVLHANEGGATDDIHKTYKFLDFFFIQSQGIWTLKVIDNAPGDKGTLDCWSLDTSCWY